MTRGAERHGTPGGSGLLELLPEPHDQDILRIAAHDPVAEGGRGIEAGRIVEDDTLLGADGSRHKSAQRSEGTRLEESASRDSTVHLNSAPWRASALGVYRFWRDLGYAVGALLSGVIADLLGMVAAIHVVAALTLASGIWVAARLPARQNLREVRTA